MKNSKLHKPLLEAVRTGLQHIFKEGSYADKEVQRILKSSKQYGSKDRSFIAETIYDIVRWKRNYEQAILKKLDHVSLDHLVVASLINRDHHILNPEIFSFEIKEEDWKAGHDGRTSFPEWIDARCSEEIGEAWSSIASALNVPAHVFIRANTLRTSPEKLLKLLEKENVKTIASPENIFSNCIQIVSKNNLKNTSLYKNGLFEFQDVGSQAIGEFCKVRRNQTVLDLCAGGGGKSLQLSALMHNTGKIYATDYNAHRLEGLHLRMRQAGCKNIEIIVYPDAKKLRSIDVLLIDAPCSGLGTIKRHPDIKWKLTNDDIEQYIRIQSSLLEDYKNLLAPNGRIIYATCSILPSENEKQVEKFLENNPQFELHESLRLQPDAHECDGFYMADIRRKN